MSGAPSVRVYAEYCALTVAERLRRALGARRGDRGERRAGGLPEVTEATRGCAIKRYFREGYDGEHASGRWC